MSLEIVNSIAAVGTFVVIAASAIAALVQLRHMRGGNQIVALTECREKLESTEFQNAREFVVTKLPGLLANPQVRQQFGEPVLPAELREATYVANFFESMGAFVRFGIIDRTIACDLWCSVVLSCWNALLPVISIRRKIDPATWENFEYLAVLSKQYTELHPTSYPRGLERMPLEHPVEST
ncbi:MAG: DUF4760 domain-containing protein [Vulcanimicrobiaceae bacterium]